MDDFNVSDRSKERMGALAGAECLECTGREWEQIGLPFFLMVQQDDKPTPAWARYRTDKPIFKLAAHPNMDCPWNLGLHIGRRGQFTSRFVGVMQMEGAWDEGRPHPSLPPVLRITPRWGGDPLEMLRIVLDKTPAAELEPLEIGAYTLDQLRPDQWKADPSRVLFGCVRKPGEVLPREGEPAPKAARDFLKRAKIQGENYFINMDLLFELYCRALLREALERRTGGVCQLEEKQQKELLVAEQAENTPFMTSYEPDMTILDKRKVPIAVLDAKNSPLRDSEKVRQYTHQVGFYMMAMGCRIGSLMCWTDDDEPRSGVIETYVNGRSGDCTAPRLTYIKLDGRQPYEAHLRSMEEYVETITMVDVQQDPDYELTMRALMQGDEGPMNWVFLLSGERFGGSLEIPVFSGKDNNQISEFEKDYWRIINCPSFRRLQDKTQVFPLDKSDFVRTRLTHSLEVSSIGRQLVEMIYNRLQSSDNPRWRPYPMTARQAEDAAEIVACAGLLHDIGNPPFGHFGEDVVKSWFADHLDELYYDEVDGNGATVRVKVALDGQAPDAPEGSERRALVEDLKCFEGNAQAFRLLTKLHRVDSERGLNLTAAVLNTIVKYPTDSLHVRPKDANVCLHKLGFYQADREDFERVANSTHTLFPDAEGAPEAFHRHPLTFILEAADDIAYATADLEDSFKKGLFTIDEFKRFFEDQVERRKGQDKHMYRNELLNKLNQLSRRYAQTPQRAFRCWINWVRYALITCAAFGFTFHYEQIMQGRYGGELLEDTNHEQTMEILKGAMKKYAYPDRGIVKLELAAKTIIDGLMSRFVPAAIDWDVDSVSRMPDRKAEEKLMGLIPEELKAAYRASKQEGDKAYNLYLRLLMVADFVSDMTDSYAKMLYQELSGF